jgi:hypothetical protein
MTQSDKGAAHLGVPATIGRLPLYSRQPIRYSAWARPRPVRRGL